MAKSKTVKKTAPKGSAKTRKKQSPAKPSKNKAKKQSKKPSPEKKLIRSKITNGHKTKEIEKELKNIYQDSQGKMPNMSKLDFKKKSKIKLVIGVIFIFAIIFGITFLGFLIFQPKPNFTGDDINLEIKAPFSTISGEKIKYEIKFTNSEKISLNDTLLTVYLPHGFIYENSNIEPQNKEQNENDYSTVKTWQINTLRTNETKSLEIEGKLIGEINTHQTISATLSYTPANFSSEFQKSISFNTEIINSLIDLDIEFPNQVANEDDVEFSIIAKNTSSEIDLNDLEIEINYPEYFELLQIELTENNEETQIIEANKNEDVGQKIITLKNLFFNNQTQILIKGKFIVEETQKAEINTKIKLKNPLNETFIQKEESFEIEIIKGELLSNLIIQGSNQNQPVNFGDTINYLIRVQNKSKNALGDIKIRAVIDSPFLDWTTLDDENDGILETNQILWTKEQNQKLAVMLPEEEIEINFKIKIKDYQDSNRYNDDDYQLKSFFETQINKIDNTDTDIVNESNTIINEINTDLSLSSYGRYFNDNNEAVGSGPLPPIVGQKTSYKIYWQIENSLNEIRDIKVTADLPDNVNFEDNNNISTGNLYLKNNQIIWEISRIPTSINKSTAEFDISITPDTADTDKILTLIPEIKIVANDNNTGGKITITNSGITTNLDNDPLAKGKGLVQSE